MKKFRDDIIMRKQMKELWKSWIGIFIKALLTTYAVMLLSDMNAMNPIVMAIIGGCFSFYKVIHMEDNRSNRTSFIVAFTLAFFVMLTGTQKMYEHGIENIKLVLSLLVIFIGIFCFAHSLLFWLYNQLKDKSVITGGRVRSKKEGNICFVVSFLLIMGCYSVFYLANYPGILTWDSVDQIAQTITGNYINHHPVWQTWIIKGIRDLCSLFTPEMNVAVAVYCCLQMIVIALIYAYVLKCFLQKGVKIWFIVMAGVYFAFMPYNIMFSFNMWKDTLFSACILLFTVLIWKNLSEERKSTLGEMAGLFGSGFIICMFRNNGFYCFLVVTAIMAWCMWKSNKRVCIVLIGTVFVALTIRGPVFKLTGVKAPDFVESLSIPVQQVAKVINTNGNLTEEQKEFISELVSLEEVAEAYDCRISDPIKGLIRQSGKQELLTTEKWEFFKLWLKIGIQNPGIYLQAYIEQTEGYWNPDIEYWQYTSGMPDTQLPVKEAPILTDKFCTLLGHYVWTKYQNVPLVGCLWSIGAMVWGAMILGGLCWVKNKKRESICFLPVFILWLTLLIATPVYAEFRYIYALFLCMPVYFVITFSPKLDGRL